MYLRESLHDCYFYYFTLMLFAEISVSQLQKMSSELFKRPLDSDILRFYFVDAIGVIKQFDVMPVRVLY